MPKRILFQGDSITDCGRDRKDFYGMGHGYANMIKGALGTDCPGEYEFINRGVSGDRSVDIYARMKIDFTNLQPDYASIFMGVNDAWHEIVFQNGVDTEKFERIYSMLIEEIQTACPQTKLMIIAPYLLEGYDTCNTEEIPDRFARFRKDTAEKAEASKRIAQKYGLSVIDLYTVTKESSELLGNYGVHFSKEGWQLLADVLVYKVKEIIEQGDITR